MQTSVDTGIAERICVTQIRDISIQLLQGVEKEPHGNYLKGILGSKDMLSEVCNMF